MTLRQTHTPIDRRRHGFANFQQRGLRTIARERDDRALGDSVFRKQEAKANERRVECVGPADAADLGVSSLARHVGRQVERDEHGKGRILRQADPLAAHQRHPHAATAANAHPYARWLIHRCLEHPLVTTWSAQPHANGEQTRAPKVARSNVTNARQNAGLTGTIRNVASVMIPSVPSDPMNRSMRSIPGSEK